MGVPAGASSERSPRTARRGLAGGYLPGHFGVNCYDFLCSGLEQLECKLAVGQVSPVIHTAELRLFFMHSICGVSIHARGELESAN